MINYLKSENYRLIHSKGPWLVLIICNLLIILATLTLVYFGNKDKTFKYDKALFLYNNVIFGSLLILAVGVLCSLFFTSKKNLRLIKISIAFDISRTTVYWSKFLLYFCYFGIIALSAFVTTIICGMVAFNDTMTVHYNFIVALVNMAPLIFGGLCLGFVLSMFKMNTALSLFITIIIYLNSDMWGELFSHINHSFNHIIKYTPGYLLDKNAELFINDSINFMTKPWMIGVTFGMIVLLVAYFKYKREEFAD